MPEQVNLETRAGVISAVKMLGLDVEADTLTGISQTCRDLFLEHLSSSLTENQNSEASRKIVRGIVHCLSPATVDQVRSIAPRLDLQALVNVAQKTPERFLSALKIAGVEGHARQGEAQHYIRATVGATEDPLARDNTPAPVTESPPLEQKAQTQRPATTAPMETSNGHKKFRSCHVYGSTYALCFNAGEYNGQKGIMVDAAVTAGGVYDWPNATHIWLNVNEVSGALAVFRRWRRSIEFAAHGSQNDKAFSLEFQDQHFFAKVVAKKTSAHPARAVKIMPTDATEVSILFLSQIAENYPNIPINELLATIRAAHTAGNG